MTRSRSCGRLACKARRLARIPVLELAVFCGSIISLSSLPPSRRSRLFTCGRTFWLFLSQVLSGGVSCRETVQRFAAAMAAAGGEAISPRTASYGAARARLEDLGLMAVSTQVKDYIQKQVKKDWLWHGHTVKPVDGSALSMPDTEKNQKEWPQSERQRPGCGFPTMRIVALFSLATGALLGLANGSLRVNERTLFRDLWDHLFAGDVVLGDRGFCGFSEFYEFGERGIHAVMRQVQRLKIGAGLSIKKRLNRCDYILEWRRWKIPSRSYTKEQWEALPETIQVRQIFIVIDVPGFRTQHFWLLTTLLDPKKYPAHDFAELYRRRWEAELYFREIKSTLGMDILTCKSPVMIRKEVEMYIIAYNLVRAVMVDAAKENGVDVARISFSAAAGDVRQWSPRLGSEKSERKRAKLYREMLNSLARDLVPIRPNRTEPRAVKRRPKSYALLTRPRALYIEIPHRKKYKKPAQPAG